jgi:predicted nucleic-acid-binding Zn-ribbon protein
MGIFSGPEPQTYEVAGRQLQCIVCGHDHFDTREAQLHTAGMTFLGLDWANRSAYCVVCANCGYIHWFLPSE